MKRPFFTNIFLLLMINLSLQDWRTNKPGSTRNKYKLHNSHKGRSLLGDPNGVEEQIYALGSSDDFSTLKEVNSTDPKTFVISPLNHDQNYLKIKGELAEYENAYNSCLNSLSDNDFSDQTVEECVGINYNFVLNDMEYEKRKLLARGDSAIRDFTVQKCIWFSNEDKVTMTACDLVIDDATVLMWNELRFAELLDFHRIKYISEHSVMPEELFKILMEQYNMIEKELHSLLNEMYDHKRLTIGRLVELISDRTSEILKNYASRRKPGYTEDDANSIHINLRGSRTINTYEEDGWRKKIKVDRTLNDDKYEKFMKKNEKNMKTRERNLEQKNDDLNGKENEQSLKNEQNMIKS